MNRRRETFKAVLNHGEWWVSLHDALGDMMGDHMFLGPMKSERDAKAIALEMRGLLAKGKKLEKRI